MSVSTISGSQGQGKSTVLNTLASRGYSVVERKTSRSILAELGLSLAEVNAYHPLTRYFQEQVLNRHLESMKPLLDSPGLHFMERSFADIFVYSNISVGPFNVHNSWHEEYYNRCVEGQALFSSIYHLTGRTFVPQEDGVRSTNAHMAGMVDREILHYVKRMDDEIGRGQLLTIALTDNEERVWSILKNCCGVE
jgi:predicted ATPase